MSRKDSMMPTVYRIFRIDIIMTQFTKTSLLKIDIIMKQLIKISLLRIEIIIMAPIHI